VNLFILPLDLFTVQIGGMDLCFVTAVQVLTSNAAIVTNDFNVAIKSWIGTIVESPIQLLVASLK